jgi:hypothetical protein
VSDRPQGWPIPPALDPTSKRANSQRLHGGSGRFGVEFRVPSSREGRSAGAAALRTYQNYRWVRRLPVSLRWHSEIDPDRTCPRWRSRS